MTVRKEGRDRVRFLGMRMEDPGLAILFKHIDCALPVFIGQMGTPVAAAEKRFIVRGDISESMRVSRTLAIVQTYLFPAFVIRMTFRRAPAMGLNHLWTKMLINLGLVPGLMLRAFK
jgi:hypothetical protein